MALPALCVLRAQLTSPLWGGRSGNAGSGGGPPHRPLSNFLVRACYTAGMEEADILRSANQLIKSYGEKAAEIAAGKVVAMQQAGDDEGMADWLDIMLAIKNLQQKNPGGGERN